MNEAGPKSLPCGTPKVTIKCIGSYEISCVKLWGQVAHTLCKKANKNGLKPPPYGTPRATIESIASDRLHLNTASIFYLLGTKRPFHQE